MFFFYINLVYACVLVTADVQLSLVHFKKNRNGNSSTKS